MNAVVKQQPVWQNYQHIEAFVSWMFLRCAHSWIMFYSVFSACCCTSLEFLSVFWKSLIELLLNWLNSLRGFGQVVDLSVTLMLNKGHRGVFKKVSRLNISVLNKTIFFLSNVFTLFLIEKTLIMRDQSHLLKGSFWVHMHDDQKLGVLYSRIHPHSSSRSR